MPNRDLNQIGLGTTPRLVIYLVSLLPLVGIVIGASYTARKNNATRAFGWRLFSFALALHAFYALCVCPASAIWLLSQ